MLHFVSIIIMALAGCQPVFIQLIMNLIDFFNPLVIQGLFDLPLTLVGACLLVILLKMCGNIAKLSFTSLLL